MSRDESDAKEIGARILQVRKKLNMNQVPFGKPLGLGQSGVSQLEKGSVGINVGTFKALAKNYDVNLYFLAFGQLPMFTPYDAINNRSLMEMSSKIDAAETTEDVQAMGHQLLAEIGRLKDQLGQV